MRPLSQRRTVLGSTSRRAATSSSRNRALSSARRSGSFNVPASYTAGTPTTVAETSLEVPRGSLEVPCSTPGWSLGHEVYAAIVGGQKPPQLEDKDQHR